MIKYSSPYEQVQLYYWHREKRGSNAEIDYVISDEQSISPVEVKSGTSGKMQSMWMFLKEMDVNKGFRLSLENFSKYDKIEIIPIYAISNLRDQEYL